MNNFQRNIYRTTLEDSVCRELVSFDYKGVGDVTFKYILCGGTIFTEHTFSGLPNSGGIYFTYMLDIGVDPVLCIEPNTFEYVSGTIVNTNNYQYSLSECTI